MTTQPAFAGKRCVLFRNGGPGGEKPDLYPGKIKAAQILNGEHLFTKGYLLAGGAFACQGIDIVDRKIPFREDSQHRLADCTGCSHDCHIKFTCHFLDYPLTEPVQAGGLISKLGHAPARSAAATASPISRVPTVRIPVDAISAVRRPASRTLPTACSIRPASAGSSRL